MLDGYWLFSEPSSVEKGTRRLREFCGGQSCFVVPCRALGSICNGHPASKVVNNQVLEIAFYATVIS